MKNLFLLLAVFVTLALPAQAQILVYGDNFSTSTPGYNNPTGWSTTTSGPDGLNTQIYAATDGAVNYFYTDASLPIPGDGSNVVGPYGFPSGTGVDTITYTKALTATFAANTTYTFSILSGTGNASHNPDAFIDILDGTSATVLATNNIGIPSQNAFSTYTVTFDTSTDPGIVGDAIALDFGMGSTLPGNTAQIDLKFANVSLTEAMAVPEPSTFALMGLGVAGLLFAMRHRSFITS